LSKIVKNKQLINNIETTFSKNIVIDTINLIFQHLSEIKSVSFEKLIFLLVSIRYKKYDNWKIVLKQYNGYISLLNKKDSNGYKPINFKSMTGCLHQLKNIYNFMTYFSDVEFENILDESIKGTSNYLLANLNENNTKLIMIVINNCSKMGLLDTSNIEKVEKVIISKIDEISASDFIGVLYSFCKNKCGSEPFYQVLEAKCRKIIMEMNKNDINPFVLSMIAKSKFISFTIPSKLYF